MKKVIVLVVLAVSILTAGCQTKKVPSATTGEKVSEGTKTVISSGYNLKPVEPGTIPALNQKEQKQVNDNIAPAIDNINNTLKSLDDVKDIDLSSLDK